MKTDSLQLHLIRESLTRPEAEEEAKKLLLTELYEEVRQSYTGVSANGGRLAELPECIKRGDLCKEDMEFSYNAIRVLYSRYLSRNELGKIVETPSMVMKRVALGFRGRVNHEKILRLLLSRKFMFNSPTLFNMYADGAYGALSACYVTPIYDDMRSIMDGIVVQAMTFKYGGGQGFSFSNLRPRWAVVRGTGSYSSGPISFMTIYDKVTDAVKQGGKRRGANMGVLHDWHPDIYNPHFDPVKAFSSLLPAPARVVLERLVKELREEGYKVSEKVTRLVEQGWAMPEDAGFIQAKRWPLGDSFLTNFNISVGVHDAFMKAVIRDEEWWMVNPQLSETTTGDGDYKIHYSVSRATGLGIIGEHLDKITTPFFSILEDEIEKAKKKGLEILNKLGMTPEQKNPYVWKCSARKIWKEIIRGAWETGDPGLLLLDNHNKWNPTPWLGIVNTCNPCGEQPLYPFENCNLGSISVEKYVEDGKFKLEEFMRDVETIVDAMDAVIDLNKHPDERQMKANLFTRKIGLGIMGLADLLAKLGYPYDSEEAVATTLIVMAGLEVFAWKRSWELGAKYGHAPAFDCKAYDWRRMKCIEKGDPDELVKMHTPALVKASKVLKTDSEWLTVKYHDIEIPPELIRSLVGETRRRVNEDGSVKLVKWSAIEKVLREVFDITPQTYIEALNLAEEEVVKSPKHLLALAVYAPIIAWDILVRYGRKLGAKAPRNTVTTTIAPTGTISIIAGTSSGIEPYFALVFERRVTVGNFLEVVRLFRDKVLEILDRHGLDRSLAEKVFEVISRHKGSIRWALSELLTILPKEVWDDFKNLARLFATAMDFDPWYHLSHNAIAQLYVDQAISKTVNLPKDVSEDYVETVYLTAWLLGLKGVTVYRDESKTTQVIVFGGSEEDNGEKLFLPEQPKRYRLALPKQGISVSELSKDPLAPKLFNIHVENGKVVMEIDENSTCKTCHI